MKFMFTFDTNLNVGNILHACLMAVLFLCKALEGYMQRLIRDGSWFMKKRIITSVKEK